MEDLPINRVLPTNGVQRILHSKDGEIIVLFRGDLMLLSPQSNGKLSSPVSNKLADHFSILRLTGSLNTNDNVLRNYLAWDSNQSIGETRQHNAANGLKITGVSISDSGISKSRSCMMLIVTDTMNGLLLKFEEGSVSTVSVINNEIVKLESINTDNIIRNWELDKLRIRALVWLKGLNYEQIDSKLWPMIPGSLFVSISQNDTCHIYQFNDVNESIERILEFSLGTNDNEWALKCDISDWNYNEFEKSSTIHSFFSIVTNLNRLIIKKVTYQLNNSEISIESLPSDKLGIFDPIVMTQLIKSANGRIMLVILFANHIQVVGLESDFKYDAKVNSHILVESMTYFYDCNDSSIVHLIFSNTFGYLGHLKFHTNEEKYEMKEHNYFIGISGNELPLFTKLNNINSEHKEKYVIDSLSTDPTHTLLEFTYYPVNFTTKIDFSSIKRDPIMFSIIKTQMGAQLDFDNVSLFNSLQTSPPYVASLSQLQNELNQHDGTFKKLSSVDPKVKLEDGNETETTDHVNKNLEDELNDGVIYQSISEAMFLNPKLEKLRIGSSKVGAALTRETRLVVLKKLARQVVHMVQAGELQTESEHDMMMFLQYCTLLGDNKVSETVCKLPIVNFDGTEETFCASNFTFDHHDGLPLTIESLEGHCWSVCEITMLPILSGEVRCCSNCGSKCISKPQGRLCGTVLTAVPICIYCGGRFV